MADDTDTTTNTAAVDAASAEAAFGSGYDAGVEDKAGKPDKADTKSPANGKAEPARDATRADAEPPPEVVTVTAKDWAEVRAAAAKTASYDQQLSRVFGTLGNITKQLSTFKATAETPAARKVEISPAAFAEMSRDFPELAAQTRAALEAALSGYTPNGAEADVTKIEGMFAQFAAKRELALLNDRYPNWREIVGAVNIASGQQPPPDNAYRKWLATKSAEYQDTLNGSELADVIGRSIRLFQKETAAPAKTNGTNGGAARRAVIQGAVQPRGDNAGAAPANTAEDAFAAGFSRG